MQTTRQNWIAPLKLQTNFIKTKRTVEKFLEWFRAFLICTRCIKSHYKISMRVGVRKSATWTLYQSNGGLSRCRWYWCTTGTLKQRKKLLMVFYATLASSSITTSSQFLLLQPTVCKEEKHGTFSAFRLGRVKVCAWLESWPRSRSIADWTIKLQIAKNSTSSTATKNSSIATNQSLEMLLRCLI